MNINQIGVMGMTRLVPAPELSGVRVVRGPQWVRTWDGQGGDRGAPGEIVGRSADPGDRPGMSWYYVKWSDTGYTMDYPMNDPYSGDGVAILDDAEADKPQAVFFEEKPCRVVSPQT